MQSNSVSMLTDTTQINRWKKERKKERRECWEGKRNWKSEKGTWNNTDKRVQWITEIE